MEQAIIPENMTLTSELELNSQGNVQLKPDPDIILLAHFDDEGGRLNYPTTGIVQGGIRTNNVPGWGVGNYRWSIGEALYTGVGYLTPRLLIPESGLSLGVFLECTDWISYYPEGGSLERLFYWLCDVSSLMLAHIDSDYVAAAFLDKNGDLVGVEASEISMGDYFNVVLTPSKLQLWMDDVLLGEVDHGGIGTNTDSSVMQFGEGARFVDILSYNELIIKNTPVQLTAPVDPYKLYPTDTQPAIITLGDGRLRRWDKSSLGFADESPFTNEYIKLRADFSDSPIPSFSGDPKTLAEFRAEADENGGYLHFEFPITSPDGDTQVELTPGWIGWTLAAAAGETDEIDAFIYQAIRDDSDFQNHSGADVDDPRIYFIYPPPKIECDADKPGYATYSRSGSVRMDDGIYPSQTNNRLYTIDVWARTKGDAEAIWQSIMNLFRYKFYHETATHHFKKVKPLDEGNHLFEADTRLYRITGVFLVDWILKEI